jgi:hypothetical protein
LTYSLVHYSIVLILLPITMNLPRIVRGQSYTSDGDGTGTRGKRGNVVGACVIATESSNSRASPRYRAVTRPVKVGYELSASYGFYVALGPFLSSPASTSHI